MAYDWETFGVTLAINAVLFVLFLVAYLWLRRTERFQRFYAPRYYLKTPGYRRPKPLPTTCSPFAWARCLLGYSEDEILAVAGYDGLVYLNIFNFGLELFGVFSVVILAAVLPVNWTGDLVDLNQHKREVSTDKDEEVESTEYDKVTMANIEEKSDVLWVHLSAVYFITFFTLWRLWKYHKRAVDLRIECLATAKRGGQSHTIFVTDIPGIRFGHPLDRLMQSCLFKFLPNSIRQRIQSSVEAMTNMATTGIGAIGTLTSNAVSRGRTMMDDTTSRVALLDTSEDTSLESFVRPVVHEITDMNPTEWIRSRLAQGMSYEQTVEEMYREVFPTGEVSCANMIVNTSSLEPLVDKLNKTVQSLEDCLDQYILSMRTNKPIKKFTSRVIPLTEGKWATEKYGQRPTKVDLLDYLVLKIENLKRTIQEEEGKAKSEVTASAFVVFNTRWSRVVGATAFFHHNETVWNSQKAPNPQEVVWENLKWRSWERSLRRVTIWFLFFLLCAFFAIPIAAIQALIEVERLEKYDVIGDIVSFPLIKSLLQAVIPNIVMVIFLAFLPTILAIMNRYQGFISRSTIDVEVTRKYFIFLIITVFLANFVARSLLEQLDLIREDMGAFVDALGSGAPQASTFFLYFILTQALISGAAEVLNLPGLVMMLLFTLMAGTRRAKDRLWQSRPLHFGEVISRHTLTLFLGIVFAVVNPLILPVTFVYFALMMLYNRYKVLYVLVEEYQSGGEIWTQVPDTHSLFLTLMQWCATGL